MFSNCNLLAMIETADKTIKLQRIAEDQVAQSKTNRTLSDAVDYLRKDKHPVSFDGKYSPQPDDMEYLCIEGFHIPKEIKDAVKNPQGLEVYVPDNGALPKIKALVIGKYEAYDDEEKYTIAFQKFKKDQYITSARHHLFFSGTTFVVDERVGIIVGSTVDCIYEDGELQFSSYYFARQIFDLSEYYREASKSDLIDFVGQKLVHVEDETFVDSANSWERRKIASIIDSGVLQKYTANKIKRLARNTGLEIDIQDNQIVIPLNRAERRVILGFLDEEVYKGIFSETVFQTNSKKRAL